MHPRVGVSTVSFRLLVLALSVRHPRQVPLLITANEITDRAELWEQRFHLVVLQGTLSSIRSAKSQLIHAKLDEKADAGKTNVLSSVPSSEVFDVHCIDCQNLGQ
jgi:hypothetical protein